MFTEDINIREIHLYYHMMESFICMERVENMLL